MGFSGGRVVKNLAVNAGDARGMGLTPGLGRSSGGGNDDLYQNSCLESSIDRGSWWATVHRVAELNMTEHLSTYSTHK